VKVQGTLEDYLVCEVVKEDEGYWIGQRRIIEDLIGKFKVFLPGRVFDTPTLNRYVVERGVEEPLEKGNKPYSGQEWKFALPGQVFKPRYC
jgi:hypothetical protein